MVTTFEENLTPRIRLLKLKEVLVLTGKSVTCVYTDPSFPRPVKIGSRSSAWVEHEVNDWIRACIANRDNNAEGVR
jgi:prophage regulatory protein